MAVVERAATAAQWLFVMYIFMLGFLMYGLFFPSQCGAGDDPASCLPSVLTPEDAYDLWVWASPERSWARIESIVVGGDDDAVDSVVSLVHAAFGLRLGEAHRANATVPAARFGTRVNNATLYAHVLMYRSSETTRLAGNATRPRGAPLAAASSAITKHLAYRPSNYTMLLGNWSAGKDAEGESTAATESVPGDIPGDGLRACDAGDGDAEDGDAEDGDAGNERGTRASSSALVPDATTESEPLAAPAYGQFVTHIRPRLGVWLMSTPPTLNRRKMPTDLGVRLVKATRRQAALGHTFAYKPPLTVDDVSLTRREYRMLSADASREDPTVLVSVTPLHVGFFRLARQMTGSLETLSDTFGMSESEVDEVKELFTATDWRWMALTFVVSLLHSWFAFLAFKNDIGFWKKKSNLEGLSVRTQWSSFVCQLIIFANLADTGQASTIILCEMGISVAIEGWKVSKFLARDGTLHRLFGVGSRAEERTQAQKDTDEYDRRAMRFLSFCLYPVVVAYGLYSLAYHPQRSWRSWVLRTLANGVYMFGFIAMTPQLYINYRLKSVAHLPWKAFMYKAFNTFIDDVFAFAIAMPTIHRLACLRDDLVFFVYLYQRWIYPIDKKRVNEFGRAYEEDDEPREGEDAPDASAGASDAKETKKDR